ncbi:MAG: hypothetical protein AAFN93_16625, partial [Bacteroidota bacterium]
MPIYGQNLKTVFEKSGGKQTATYQEAIHYYESLAESSEFVKMSSMGSTDSGEPLHVITLDLDKDFDFNESH